jgi:hypothetical protein
VTERHLLRVEADPHRPAPAAGWSLEAPARYLRHLLEA